MIVPMQIGVISEVVLSTLNFPQNLTDFTCVYQIKTLRVGSEYQNELRGRVNATSYDVENGLVGCPLSVNIKQALLEACEYRIKLHNAVVLAIK